MRALVSSVGTRGDVQPVLALGVAMRAEGADVRLAIPPNFVEWANTLGFAASPVGIEMRARGGAPATPPTPDELKKLGEDLIQQQFDAIGAAAPGCDLVVAAGAHQYAARSVAESLGIPCISAVYAPVSIPSPDHAPPPHPGQPWQDAGPDGNLELWASNRQGWNARALGRVAASRARLGLAPIDDVLGHILGDRCWLAADPTLGPAPSSPDREVVQVGAWLLDDPAPLPAPVDAFLAAGEPPVYLGFGSMPVQRDVGAALVAAAVAGGRRVIVGQGWADLAADGADCLAVGDVSHAALFPRCAAIVHHGGAGTTTAAARAGVPQVIVPMFSDQPYWASRVRDLGIGTSAPLGHPASLGPAIAAALDTAVAERARALATAIVQDGAAIAARRLLAGA